jgi:hypothetical protein
MQTWPTGGTLRLYTLDKAHEQLDLLVQSSVRLNMTWTAFVYNESVPRAVILPFEAYQQLLAVLLRAPDPS